jgi:hypothetical protein
MSYTPADPILAKRVDFASDTIIYRGEAAVGSSEGDPVWRIKKIILGADDDVTELWADGVSDFTKVWSNRLSLSYI